MVEIIEEYGIIHAVAWISSSDKVEINVFNAKSVDFYEIEQNTYL
jgi:hypothetical protein